MILIRDIFRLKFGQAKEATGLWKQALAELRKAAPNGSFRLMTDVAGAPYYTIVLEGTYPSLEAWENMHKSAPGQTEWKALYAKIIPLTETGHREIFSIIE